MDVGEIPIWGDPVPYNTGEDKLSQMHYAKHMPKVISLVRGVHYLFAGKFKQEPKELDTLTYVWEIKPGRAETTFTDRPGLTPYLVHGSDKAVVVIPGGGFTCITDSDEGGKVAQWLNREGISAFVLRYRINPYHIHVPLLDAQRAVRFVRFHAKEYGINPRKIGVLGFSAGGYMTSSIASHTRGYSIADAGYQPDEVDAASDKVAFSGLVYPALTMRYTPCILYACFDNADVNNPKTREDLIVSTELYRKVGSDTAPHYICYGTKDQLTLPQAMDPYVDALQKHNIPVKLASIEGAGHGFAGSEKYSYWFDGFSAWANELFELER